MTRRKALQTMMLAGTALPVVATIGSSHESHAPETGEEGEYAVASLMAVLLDLTDEEFHAKPDAQRELLMGALYDVLNHDPQAIALWAQSIAARDKQALTNLHVFLKARAQAWESALECPT